MRGVRGTILRFLMAGILVSECRAQDKPVLSRSPLSEEQLSVYRGFLNKFSFLHFRNLSSVTVPFDFKGFPDSRPCLDGIELENVAESLRTAHRFEPEIAEGRELKLVNPLEQSKLLQQRDASPNIQRERMTPEAQHSGPELNFLVLSEIVFDKKHQFAVLKYLLVCGEHCATGQTLVMEKVDGKWTASSRRPCAMLVGY